MLRISWTDRAYETVLHMSIAKYVLVMNGTKAQNVILRIGTEDEWAGYRYIAGVVTGHLIYHVISHYDTTMVQYVRPCYYRG